MNRGVVAVGLVFAAVAFSGACIYKDSAVVTSTDGTITLKMAQTSSEAGAIGQSMNQFADIIYERTNGRYNIEVFHNGQLGAEIDTIEGCQMGTIDIAVVNQSTLGNFIKDFPALDIPYMITSTKHADQVFLGEIGQHFLDELSDVQLYGLGIWESGFRNLTNSKVEINALDNIKSLKIRTMENQIHIAFWKALGADATPMAWGEAYTALQQGALDGQENPSSVILTNNVAQVNRYLAVTEHAYSTVFLVMSPETWASLGEENQKIFKEVVLECGLEERQLSRQMDGEAIQQLKEQGMTVTYPDKKELINAAAELYIDWESQYGEIINQIRALQDSN